MRLRGPTNKERREPGGARLSYFSCSAYFLQQPEAQHSGESQLDAVAAFTAPAKPSVIAATNKIALILFIEILP
jgi:hypothetical protein